MEFTYYQDEYARLQASAERESGRKEKFFSNAIERIRNFFTRRTDVLQETPEIQYLQTVIGQQTDQKALARFRDRERRSNGTNNASFAHALVWEAPPADVISTDSRKATRRVVVRDRTSESFGLRKPPTVQRDSHHGVTRTRSIADRGMPDTKVPRVTQPLEAHPQGQSERIIDDLFQHFVRESHMEILPKNVFPPEVQEAYLIDHLKVAYDRGKPNVFATALLSAEEDAVLAQLYNKALDMYRMSFDRAALVTQPLGQHFLDDSLPNTSAAPGKGEQVTAVALTEDVDVDGVVTLLGSLRNLYRNWRDVEWDRNAASTFLRQQVTMGKTMSQILRGHTVPAVQLAAMQDILTDVQDIPDTIIELRPSPPPRPAYMEERTWVMMQPGYIPEKGQILESQSTNGNMQRRKPAYMEQQTWDIIQASSGISSSVDMI